MAIIFSRAAEFSSRSLRRQGSRRIAYSGTVCLGTFLLGWPTCSPAGRKAGSRLGKRWRRRYSVPCNEICLCQLQRRRRRRKSPRPFFIRGGLVADSCRPTAATATGQLSCSSVCAASSVTLLKNNLVCPTPDRVAKDEEEGGNRLTAS